MNKVNIRDGIGSDRGLGRLTHTCTCNYRVSVPRCAPVRLGASLKLFYTLPSDVTNIATSYYQSQQIDQYCV